MEQVKKHNNNNKFIYFLCFCFCFWSFQWIWFPFIWAQNSSEASHYRYAHSIYKNAHIITLQCIVCNFSINRFHSILHLLNVKHNDQLCVTFNAVCSLERYEMCSISYGKTQLLHFFRANVRYGKNDQTIGSKYIATTSFQLNNSVKWIDWWFRIIFSHKQF